MAYTHRLFYLSSYPSKCRPNDLRIDLITFLNHLEQLVRLRSCTMHRATVQLPRNVYHDERSNVLSTKGLD